MKLLALDPSTKSTGVAVFDEEKLVFYDCLCEDDLNVLNRITNMVNKIEKIVIKYKPDTVVTEEILLTDVNNNQQVFKALMYLQAAIALSLNKFNLKIDKFFIASNWRKTVGIKTGRGVYRDALKKASMKLVKEHYGIDVNNDVSDSICIGISYLKKQDEEFNWE